MILSTHNDPRRQVTIFILEIPDQEMEWAYKELSRLNDLMLKELNESKFSIADKIVGLESICRKIEQTKNNV